MLTYSTDDGVSVAIDFDRRDVENVRTGAGRMGYRYVIDVADVRHEGCDLRSGTYDTDNGRPPGLAEMFATLCSFIGAAIESHEYAERTGREGDCSDLFPADVLAALAAVGADAFAMMAEEVTGGDDD